MRRSCFLGRHAAGATLTAMLLAGTALAAPPGTDPVTGLGTGPSSSQTPYVVPNNPQAWTSTSLLTVGDTIGGYTMTGIPDGLGAYDNGNGTITVLMNQELPAGVGPSHPGTSLTPGAFVSKWVVDKNTLQVLSGGELIQTVVNAAGQVQTTALNRLCSADLPALSAFYNAATGLGYNGRIFMTGEETAGGRQFGVVATGGGAVGTAYQLPLLGSFAHENALASPNSGNKTVVIGQDDTTPSGPNGGRIAVYVGTKTNSGTAVDMAGLTNGTAFSINVTGVTAEDRNTGIGAGPKAFTLAAPNAGTQFLRPEDGAWDTKNPNVFYFVTTDRLDTTETGAGQIGRSRLWKVTFSDVTDPSLGGTIEAVVNGTEGGNMFDNITVDADGKVYLQEDTGNAAHNAKIWVYDPATGALTQIYRHDRDRFGDLALSATAPFTQDEESSGILDVTDLFRDASWFDPANIRHVLLADVQAHYPNGSLVEGGQLLLLAEVPEPASLGVLALGLAGVGALRRRRR